ncbi:MAG: AAA family ATPase [Nitrososphaerales archaeon]
MEMKPDLALTGEEPQPGFFERNIQPREEIMEGLFREGQLIVVAGRFGVGKSPLVSDLIMHTLSGREWCGRAVRQRPVISFDFENSGPSYKQNILNICGRLNTPSPKVPDQLEVYLEQDSPEELGTKDLLDVLKESSEKRLAFIRDALERKPNALVIIDPLEMLFRIDTLKKSEVLGLYTQMRFLLSDFPQAAILMTFNLRKRDRRAAPPDLMSNPRDWLEEVCGSLDILNRSDVRLGMDFYNDDIRVINGIRRGEEMEPILVKPVGDSPDKLAGFELSLANEVDLKSALTATQQSHWEKLPDKFSFEEIADKSVPRTSLHRLINRTQSLGALKQEGGHWVKQ